MTDHRSINYLFSCQVCNQSFKGNSFPTTAARMAPEPPLPVPFPTALTAPELSALAARLAPDPLHDEEGMPLAQFIAAALAEQASLIDPYMVDPASILAWDADTTNQMVKAAPRDQQPATLAAFVVTARAIVTGREPSDLGRPRALRPYAAAATSR